MCPSQWKLNGDFIFTWFWFCASLNIFPEITIGFVQCLNYQQRLKKKFSRISSCWSSRNQPNPGIKNSNFELLILPVPWAVPILFRNGQSIVLANPMNACSKPESWRRGQKRKCGHDLIAAGKAAEELVPYCKAAGYIRCSHQNYKRGNRKTPSCEVMDQTNSDKWLDMRAIFFLLKYISYNELRLLWTIIVGT